MALLGRQISLARGPSLQSFSTYIQQESEADDRCAVNSDGRLLEYETLALRLHPPNTHIDNRSYPDRTVLIIDSANRPGTLVEVVQCLAELQLSVLSARISCDGGWFVDEFHVTDRDCAQVTDERKLNAIRKVLAVGHTTTAAAAESQTVFQIAGPERYGVLADILHLLCNNGVEVCSIAAWTHAGRAAAVLGVKGRGGPIPDSAKVAALRQRLAALVSSSGDVAVTAEHVSGPVHHERRLHQLLLADAQKAWKQLNRLQKQHSMPFPSTYLAALAAAAAAGDASGDDTAGDRDQQPQLKLLGLPGQLQSPRTPAAVAAAWSSAWQKGHEDYVAALLQQQAAQKQQQHRSGMAAAVQMASGRPAQQQRDQQRDQQQQGEEEASEPTQQPAGAWSTSGSCLPQVQSLPLLPGADRSCGAPDMGGVLSLLTPVPEHELEGMSAGSFAPPHPQQPRAQQQAPGAAAGSRSNQAGEAVAGQHSQEPGAAHGSPVRPAPTNPAVLPSVPGGIFASAAGARAAAAAVVGPSAGAAPEASGGVQPPAAAGQQCDGLQAATRSTTPQQQQQVAAAPPQRPFTSPWVSLEGRPAASGSGWAAPTRGMLYSSKSLGSPRMVSAAAATAAKVEGLHLTIPAPYSPAAHGPTLAPQGPASPWSPAAARPAAQPLPSPSAMYRGGQGGAGVATQPQMVVLGRSPKHSEPLVSIQHNLQRGYWVVSISARDRNKLLFDTVCTMSDMRYDVYHGTVDSGNEVAQQLFYVRPRFGPVLWDEEKASQLTAMLEAAVQRRFPRGCKVHVFSGPCTATSSSGGRSSSSYLADLTAAFKKHQLSVTRCKVRAYGSPSHTFYLLTASGQLPSKAQVIQVCQDAGGELLEAPLLEAALLSGASPGSSQLLRGLELRGHFGFYVRERRTTVVAPGAPAGAKPQAVSSTGTVRGGIERGWLKGQPTPAQQAGAAPGGRAAHVEVGGPRSMDSDRTADSF